MTGFFGGLATSFELKPGRSFELHVLTSFHFGFLLDLLHCRLFTYVSCGVLASAGLKPECLRIWNGRRLGDSDNFVSNQQSSELL